MKSANGDIRVQLADVDLLQGCRGIRRIIFQIGQNVPKEHEEDGFDEEPFSASCAHFAAALHDGTVIGTCRVRQVIGYVGLDR